MCHSDAGQTVTPFVSEMIANQMTDDKCGAEPRLRKSLMTECLIKIYSLRSIESIEELIHAEVGSIWSSSIYDTGQQLIVCGWFSDYAGQRW